MINNEYEASELPKLQDLNYSGFKVKIVYRVEDYTEEERKLIGYFSDKKIAEKAGEGKGDFDDNGWRENSGFKIEYILTENGKTGFLLNSERTKIFENERESIRERALKKLTDMELVALGLRR